jgi:hypothetical protein
VHFDNEVHLRKMHQKVHLAKMHRLYVGIRKNHMDQIKKNKKVHLAEMHFFVHFLKVGLFTPALVIDSVQTIIFQVPQVPHTPQHPFTPRVRYDRVIHTATKPKTQHDHIPQQNMASYHRRCCLFRRCLRARQPPPRAIPPHRAPDNDDEDKETTMRRS